MIRRTALAALLLLTALPAQKQPKPPDIEVTEITVRREEGKVRIDGRAKNTGLKPLRGVLLLIDFLSSDKIPVTTKRGPINAEELPVGEETDFHLEVASPPRAVSVFLNSEDASGRDLRVGNAGPFNIEE